MAGTQGGCSPAGAPPQLPNAVADYSTLW